MTKKEASGQIIKYPMFIGTFDKSLNIKDVIATNNVCSCLVIWERYKSSLVSLNSLSVNRLTISPKIVTTSQSA
jgi:hypothetical protein